MNYHPLTNIIVLVISFISLFADSGKSQEDPDIEFPVNFTAIYRKDRPPFEVINGSVIPAWVKMDMRIIRDPSVNENDQVIILDSVIGFYWFDYRVQAETGIFFFIAEEFMNQMWVPEIMFHPTKISETSNGRCSLDTLSLDTTRGEYPYLRYFMTCTRQLFCDMAFDAYPMDVHKCQWKIIPNVMQKYLNLTWYPGAELSVKAGDWGSNYMELPLFKFRFTTGELRPLKYGSKSLPKRLSLTLYLEREISTYLLMTYFPSGLMVLVSWCSFIIKPDIVPGRIALIITTLLTLVTMFNSLREKLRPSFKVKPVEQWMIACMTFVVAALMEYAVVLLGVRCKSHWRRGAITPHGAIAVQPAMNIRSHLAAMKSKRARVPCASRGCLGRLKHRMCREGSLDMVSLFVFPLLFLIFNIQYWAYNLTAMSRQLEQLMAADE